jgi:hypothetical protein
LLSLNSLSLSLSLETPSLDRERKTERAREN